jgi:hypothetical protein
MTNEIKDQSAENEKKWGAKEKAAWLAQQVIHRSYREEVVERLEAIRQNFEVTQYGALSYIKDKYPLFIAQSNTWEASKPVILVTGGVHGYETSGVHGALRFLETSAKNYTQHFNLLVAPCVSPWGYETINRWNPNTIDPNRSFFNDTPVEESGLLMKAVAELLAGKQILAHIDLHETTDTDNSVFMPALAARDGEKLIIWEIPDGFYTVGDLENPQPDFQRAIINSVKKVTHIAPSDKDGNIIGEPTSQPGVINYPKKKLGLCAGFSNAKYVTTTEVYPDSPTATPEDCIKAQVAAIEGGLDYLVAQL